MNSNKKLLAVLVIGAALWAAFHFGTKKNETLNEDLGPQQTVDMPLPAGPQNPAPGSISSVTTAAPTSSDTPALLGPHLKKIGECLGINNSLNDSAEMTFAALNSSVQNELGGLVDQNLDWKNVHVTLPNGEKRRIRMEVEGVGEEGSLMRLKYYGVDNEDLPVPMPLPDDQTANPSESFLASLEGEGQVTMREEAHRGVYTKGSELYYVERNGTLSELEIIHHGRSVKCQELQSAQGTCNCF